MIGLMAKGSEGMHTDRRRLILAVLVVSIFSFGGNAFGDELAIGGYYKSFFVAYDPPDYRTDLFVTDFPIEGTVTNNLRLNGHWRVNRWLSLETSYSIAPQVSSSGSILTGPAETLFEPAVYRVTDFDSQLFPGENDPVGSFSIHQNLDRAAVSISAGRVDLFLGRQAIAWGSARAVNPTDILAPYAYTELDTEDRIGVDAVRLRYPLGFMGEIDAGCVFGNDFEASQSACFLRGKFYLARTDVSLLAVNFRENLLVGVDLARSIGGAGAWLEAGYVVVDAFDSDDVESTDDDYLRATIGADYSFGGDIYGFIEYHYNGAGSTDASQYVVNSETKIAYREGNTYLAGQHYLIPGVTRQLTPLISGGVEAMINLRDPSALIATSVEYNVADNIYLKAGAFIGWGSQPSLRWTPPISSIPVVIPASEFGSYQDTFYSSFRVYF